MDAARRFIADIGNHPLLKDGRSHAGPVQIIDLACIREALGDKWSTYAGVIHRIAVRTIEKHLDTGHSYLRREDCYVLTFKGAEPQSAADLTRAIAVGLATYLFGTGKNDVEPMADRGRSRQPHDGRSRLARLLARMKSILQFRRLAPGWLRPKRDKTKAAAEAEANNSAAHGRHAMPKGGGMATVMDGTPRSVTAVAGEESAGRSPATVTAPRAADRGARAASLARETVSATVAVTPPPALRAEPATPPRVVETAQVVQAPAAAPVVPRDLGPEATPPMIKADLASPSQPMPPPVDPEEIGALENAMIAASRRLAREGERHAYTPPVRGLHYFYRPMWSVRTNMLAISSCVPVARLPSGEMVTGAAVVPQGASPDFIQMLDHSALTHVLNDGQRLAEAERSTLVAIPVHYETLSEKDRRAAYLKMCQGLPPRARRRILFECLGIHQGLGQSQLVAGIMALKPFCALTVGQLPLDTNNFSFWKTSGLTSVGVDIHDQLTGSSGGEAELIERLERFVYFTSQAGLRSYVRGLNTLSLAAAAVAAGFDFVEGGIIQDQIEPSDVRSFTLEDLYLQFAGARRAPSRLAS